MSDTLDAESFDYDEAPTPEVDPTEIGGQVGTEGFDEPSFFDPTPHSDELVKVKVNGEELSVPLSEALAGYQRTADYTRKTQELAEQRQAVQFAQTLQQALEADPARTISYLQEQYGLSNAQAAQLADQYQQDDDDDWLADPLERRIQEFERKFQAWEQQQAQVELQGELKSLQARYGQDFNPQEVVQEALRRGTDDLEGVYKAIAFDRLFAARQAEAEAQAATAADEERRTKAKVAASGVHTGPSAAGVTAAPSTTPTSIADAFRAAKAELGF